MSNPPGMRLIPVYVPDSVFRILKVYAAETDQTIQDVARPLADEYNKLALELVTEIENMRAKVVAERLKKEEEQKLADQFPLEVSGEPTEPITEILEPITS